MTIKEKLIKLDIDFDKQKDLIEEIKKELAKAGENSSKISNKLSSDGIKIIESVVNRYGKKDNEKHVSRPKTIKSNHIKTEDNNSKQTLDNSLEAKKDNSKNEDDINKQGDKTVTTEAVPFWEKKSNNKNNLKISIKGQNILKPKESVNGRPLPQSTINELKKKKIENINKAKENIHNNDRIQGTNTNRGREFLNEKHNEKNNNKNNNFTSNNKYQRRPDNKTLNNQKVNLSGKNLKTTFNQGNSTIAIGTNNRFEGRKKDKNKFNNNFENKAKQSKGAKNKSEKYKTSILNYEIESKVERKKKKTGAGAFVKPEPRIEKPGDDIKSITISETVTIRDFASKLRMQAADIVKKLFLEGKLVTPNTELTYEEAENIAIDYNILCEKETKIDVIAELLKEKEENVTELESRPPVVCVMGHVDHGKTSILDVIRKTNVTTREAGGITQHIGAYQVNVKNRLITFLDTPGHEAFTAMRLRGAKSTDIAILVVAADDGVKPQTIEAINHARSAGVEIIVAVNKIDKADANVERVKQQLSEHELVPADWGGQTTYCEVSAKTGGGIDNLLDMILLTADVLELKANKNRKARGIVIESLLDKGKGPVARILVQKGTLHVGDYVAMGPSFGKVRAMIDCNGERVKEAYPSMPVEILGLNGVPQAGDTFVCFDDEKDARSFAETFVSENKKKLVEDSKQSVSLDEVFEKIKAGELKELNIILKSDVAGSSEAIKSSLEKLSNDEVVVKVIHDGVGNINESDVTLALASKAIIIGFNVKPEPNTKSLIDKEKVDLRLYNIIYNAIDDVEKAMKGLLAPVYEEKIIGSCVVRQVFKASSIGKIAGLFVNDGEIRRNAKVRVKHGDNQVYDGEIISLKRFKDEAKEVKAGFECGVVLQDFVDYSVDDIFEVYVVEEKKV